jgi:hypothetical protein
MQQNSREKIGIQCLVDMYRKQFRIPENLRYYAKKDFKVAQRKFIKLALSGCRPKV